jgi:DNA-binding response OmpR family regulator
MGRKKITILIVDDESTIREVLHRYLEKDGFRVLEAEDGVRCLQVMGSERPDLLLLDLMLPGIDGFSVLSQIRQDPNLRKIPVIMLTAKGETHDRIRGLDHGADDYIPKPFSPREVISRVNAVLRRTRDELPLSGEPLRFRDLEIDPQSRSVRVAGKPVNLSAKEFDLLWYFATHPRQVFPRDQLLEKVWGYEYFGDSSTVTVFIRRLREKIEADPSKPTLIHTVWGVGYKFEAEP